MRLNKAILTIAFATLALMPKQVLMAMSQDEYRAKIRQWHIKTGGGISLETFEKGATWFLDKCNKGSCNPCLISISDHVSENTLYSWIGSFDSNGPVTILNTKMAVNRSSNNHEQTPAYAGKYGRCIQGSSKFSCSGSSCKLSGGLHNTTYPASTVATLEKHLGEKAEALIMYGVLISGQRLLHDGLHCYYKSSCEPTWGCQVQYPRQQRDLCRNFINPNGGIFLYTDINNQNPGGNWQSAAQAMEKGNFCKTVNGPSIASVTPINGTSSGPASRSRAGFERYQARTSERGSLTSASNQFSGSDSFIDCQQTSSKSYPEEVASARSQNTESTRTGLAQDAAQYDSVYGGGEANARAVGLNNLDKNCRAGASAEPRSGGFFSSLGTFFNQLFGGSTTGDNPRSIGNPNTDSERFSPGREINTNFSTQQDMQMEAAVQAHSATNQLYDSERAVWNNTAEDTRKNYNIISAQYSKSGDKQADAQMTSVSSQVQQLSHTASENMRVQRLRAAVLTEHLKAFPTLSKLQSNCENNFGSAEENNQVYDIAMKEIKEHYDEEFNNPPTYEGNRCQDYINDNKDYIALNEQIPSQLEPMIEDSLEIAEHMEDVLSVLSDVSIPEIERLKLASENQGWALIAERGMALDKCEKEKCLDEMNSKLAMLTDYEGSATYGTPELRNVMGIFNRYKASNNSFDESDFKQLMNTSLKDFNSKSAVHKSISGTGNRDKSGLMNLKQLGANLVDGNSSAQNSAQQMLQANTRLIGGNGIPSGAYRDENGVLRSKDGKSIWGFEAAKHLNLFDIISNRYRKRFMEKH